jgi:hypothetical protein
MLNNRETPSGGPAFDQPDNNRYHCQDKQDMYQKAGDMENDKTDNPGDGENNGNYNEQTAHERIV